MISCIVDRESAVIEADDQTIKSESQYNPNYKDAERRSSRWQKHLSYLLQENKTTTMLPKDAEQYSNG